MATEFWLVSVPGEPTCQQAWDKLNAAVSKQNNLSINHKFAIPDLKVGTLDVLVGLSDDLGKVDAYCESVARKVSAYLADVLEGQRDKLQENLLANGMDLSTYLTRFQWDMAKYPIKLPMPNIATIISKQCTQIENDLKTKSQSYNTLKGNLINLERKQTGSLLTRNLYDLVKKEHFVLDSEYLVTLVVVVNKSIYDKWLQTYEKLTDYVVPRSSMKITEDSDNVMVTVTLFRRIVDTYKHACRENKFIVRDFEFREADVLAGKDEISKLEDDRKKQFGPLVRWLKVNFSEAFTAWVHVKAMRVFVESVLRYGLPVNFQAVLLCPHRRSVKQLRSVLAQLYSYLDSTDSSPGGASSDVEIPGLIGGLGEYYPYVYFKLSIDMIDTKR